MVYLIYPVSVALFANIAIYLGIAFVNAQLLPSVLADFYQHASVWVRVLIMSVVTAPLANYLFSLVYKKAGAGNAGMIIISTLALVLIGKAVLIHGGGLNIRIVLAAMVLIGAALWVAFELHRMTN